MTAQVSGGAARESGTPRLSDTYNDGGPGRWLFAASVAESSPLYVPADSAFLGVPGFGKPPSWTRGWR